MVKQSQRNIRSELCGYGTQARGSISIHSSDMADTVYTPRYSPNGKTIATYSKDETIRLWNVLTGENIKTFTDVPKVFGYIVFSPDGKIHSLLEP